MMRGRVRAGAVAAALALSSGCGDSSATPDSDGGTSTGNIPPTTSTTSPGDGSTGTTDPADTGFDPPDPMCGNGFVEADEQCDDGNDENDDACSNACLIPCGIEWAAVELPPTADSEIDGLLSARDGEGSVVIAGQLREITTDQEGNETAGPFEALVAKYDAGGEKLWDIRIVEGDRDEIVDALTVDDAGDVYLETTIDDVDGGTNILLRKLAAADGSTLWQHVISGKAADNDDTGSGVALAPDGNPVVAGQVRVGDGDTDIWVRKLDAVDGTEIWTNAWTGPGNGTFSIDVAGPLAIGPNGDPYVLGREYIEFNESPLTLVHFNADGTDVVSTYVPEIEGSLEPDPLDLAADADGNLYLVYIRDLQSDFDFRVERIDSNESRVWVLQREDFETEGTEWFLVGVETTDVGDVVAGGRYLGDDDAWRVWNYRLDSDASVLCSVLHAGQSDSLLAPDLFARGLGLGLDGGAVLVGDRFEETDEALWLGRFRAE